MLRYSKFSIITGLICAVAAQAQEVKAFKMSHGRSVVTLDLPPIDRIANRGAAYALAMDQGGSTVTFKAPFQSVAVSFDWGRSDKFEAAWNVDVEEGSPHLAHDTGFTRHVTYKVKKNDWYVASGTAQDRADTWIFYTKVLKSGDALVRVQYTLSYASDEDLKENKPGFDKLIERSQKTIKLAP